MNIDLIGKTWDRLEGRHLELMHRFYKQLFERYPNYEALFPKEMDRHMPRMVQTFANMSRLADHPEVTEAHLYKIGQKHQTYDLDMADLYKFKEVFLVVLSELCGDQWTEDMAQAWNEAFETRLLPQIHQGITTTSAANGDKSHFHQGAPAHWYPYV